MTWPAGIQTVTVTFGQGRRVDGVEVASVLKVELIAPNVKALTWNPDGVPMLAIAGELPADPGAEGRVMLPVVDQPGWTDDSGAAFTMWAYRLTQTAGRLERVKYLQPMAGQTTIDFDEIPDGEAGVPVSAPIIPVYTVNGKTGSVVLGAPDVGAAPTQHTHEVGDIAGLLATLEGKASTQDLIKGLGVKADSSAVTQALDALRAQLMAEVVAGLTPAQLVAFSGTVFVDSFPKTGTLDTDRIQAAVDFALANGAGKLVFGHHVYETDTWVSIDKPTAGLHLIGGRGRTIFRRPGSRAGRSTIFRVSPEIGDKVENLVFEGMTFWGGMSNVFDMATNRARGQSNGNTVSENGVVIQYEAGTMHSAISVNGALVKRIYRNAAGDVVEAPPENGVVRNLTVRQCDFIGIPELPVFFRGVSGICVVEDSWFYRCLDPGWVYCEDARAIGNRSEYSMDNGFSLSRGCRSARAIDNTIIAPWYNGVWFGGFGEGTTSSSSPIMAGGPGPREAIAVGNNVQRPGQAAFWAAGCFGRVVISGNLGVGGPLPSVKDSQSGVGVYVDPWSASTGSEVPLSIEISGNTFEDFHRAGVDARGYRTMAVTGNIFRAIGWPTNPDGTGRPIDDRQRTAIAGSLLSPLSVTSVAGNVIADQRGGAAALGYPINIDGGLYSGAGNAIYGNARGSVTPA